MGEVFHAFQHLNETLKLGLSGKQLARAEAGFKSKFALVSNPDPLLTRLKGDADAITQEYEFVAVLQPRARKLSATELQTMADKAVKTNLADVKLNAIPVDIARLQGGVVKTTTPKATTPKATTAVKAGAAAVKAGAAAVKIATTKAATATAATAKSATTRGSAAKVGTGKLKTP